MLKPPKVKPRMLEASLPRGLMGSRAGAGVLVTAWILVMLAVGLAIGDPPPEPTGACCLGQGMCMDITLDECIAAGGLWIPDSACPPTGESGPCEQLPGGYD